MYLGIMKPKALKSQLAFSSIIPEGLRSIWNVNHWLTLMIMDDIKKQNLVFYHLKTLVPEVKSPPANAGDIRDKGLIPGSGRYPGGGHSNPLQYSCLENPMERGAWRATVHRFTELDMTEAT